MEDSLIDRNEIMATRTHERPEDWENWSGEERDQSGSVTMSGKERKQVAQVKLYDHIENNTISFVSEGGGLRAFLSLCRYYGALGML